MPDEADLFFIDTVSLSNFALIRRLDLLAARYGRRLHITIEVRNEVAAGVVAGYQGLEAVEAALQQKVFTLGKPSDSPEERQYFQSLLRVLSPGEASCMVAARFRGGVVITDDRAARLGCADAGIRCTGTVGVLLACCRDGRLYVGAADDVLKAMIAQGYRSPVVRVSDLL